MLLIVVVDIFYLQHMISYRKYFFKGALQCNHTCRRDLLISILDLTYSTRYKTLTISIFALLLLSLFSSVFFSYLYISSICIDWSVP